MKKILFLIVVLILIGVTIPSATITGKLQGFVYGDDGRKPLANAQVFIREKNSKIIYQSMPTEKNGAYKIENIIPGVYSVGIKYDNKDYNIDALLVIRIEKQWVCFTLPKVLETSGYVIRCNSPKCFFITPCGWALVTGITGGILVGIIKVTEKEVSPTGI